MNKPKHKPVTTKKKSTAAQREAADARASKIVKFQLFVGYAIVGISVVLAWSMSLFPQLFGLKTFSPAISVGLTVLAVIRMAAVYKEMRRERANAPAMIEINPASAS